MKRVLSLFLVSLFCASVFAIPDNAIDFTVKDSNGKQHNLFTYLTSGKYVLIKFTTTW